MVEMRNVVSSQHGVGTGGEGFVVSFLCKLFNHQPLQIKAAPWIQFRSAGVKYRLSGGEREREREREGGRERGRGKWKMICKLN